MHGRPSADVRQRVREPRRRRRADRASARRYSRASRESLKWQDELASQTRRLLIYPTMVMLVVLAVVLFLLIYLVPQVTMLLKTMGVALPLQTRALIAASNIVVDWWPLIFGVPIAGAIGIRTRCSAKARASSMRGTGRSCACRSSAAFCRRSSSHASPRSSR